MALIDCHECGGKLSTDAKACPHCGAAPKLGPVAKVKREPNFFEKCLGMVFLIAIAYGAYYYIAGPSASEAKPQASEKEVCASTDLQCLGDRGVIYAGGMCERQIEALSKYSMRWTDGTFESKFSRFRWKKQSEGLITYLGDKAEFQNGFGAYTNVVYECDLSADNKTVLDARVKPGRLP